MVELFAAVENADLAVAVIKEDFDGRCRVGGRQSESRGAERDNGDVGGEELGSCLSARLQC